MYIHEVRAATMAKRPWAKLHIQTVNYQEVLGVVGII